MTFSFSLIERKITFASEKQQPSISLYRWMDKCLDFDDHFLQGVGLATRCCCAMVCSSFIVLLTIKKRAMDFFPIQTITVACYVIEMMYGV